MPPKVSVNIACYNHEKYIGQALQSVLDQTFQDVEIFVLNNGSTDNSLRVIESYKDSRIHVESVFPNKQSTWAGRYLMEKSTGEYVALLCSDDIWEKDKLQKQVEYLNSHPQAGAVFTRVQPMGDRGQLIHNPKNHYHRQFNTLSNRTAPLWLRDIWQRADHSFCCSSALIRREVLQESNYYDVRLKYIQDMTLWADILTKHEVYILDEKLTKMRYFSNHTNLSAGSLKTSFAILNESFVLYEQFKKMKDIKQFLEFMPQTREYFSCLESQYIPFYLAILTIKACPKIHFKQAALKDLYDQMALKENRDSLERNFKFTHLDLYRLAEEFYPNVWKQNIVCRMFPFLKGRMSFK